ncbi:IS66 family transposase [Sphingobium quisquiliarum]|uniref:IS66 family transposase n=1 Tax=Sphingobium quisquiliarum TaxID=538379 RepID=UPI0009FBB461
MLAHVVVPKFDHHLPLYRQAEIMAAQGYRDRPLDAGGLGRQASVLLDPIVSRIREGGLTASKIHTDDTPVPMLHPGRGKTAPGRLWAYAVDDRGSGATTPSLVRYGRLRDECLNTLVLVFGRCQEQDRGVVEGLQRDPASHTPGVHDACR